MIFFCNQNLFSGSYIHILEYMIVYYLENQFLYERI
jgi:hypothetical protein